eukprot:1127535-Pyramimonas_sp.AAC.1
MRAPPLGPSVELPMETQDAVLSGGPACELRHWGLWWGSLSCHETLYWAEEPHASSATGTFGGAPHRATKSCTGRGKPHASSATGTDIRWSSLCGLGTLHWVFGNHMQAPPRAPPAEIPMGPRSAALGGG